MNQKSGVSRRSSRQAFTEKQGEYLAFIYVYSHMFQRPPAETDMQCYSVSAHPPFTKWSSRSSAMASSAVNPACRAVSKSSFLSNKFPSSNGSKSTSQILCDKILDTGCAREHDWLAAVTAGVSECPK